MDNSQLLVLKSQWDNLNFSWFKFPLSFSNNRILQDEKFLIFKGKEIIHFSSYVNTRSLPFALYLSLGKTYILYVNDNDYFIALTSGFLDKLYSLSISYFGNSEYLLKSFGIASFLTDYPLTSF